MQDSIYVVTFLVSILIIELNFSPTGIFEKVFEGTFYFHLFDNFTFKMCSFNNRIIGNGQDNVTSIN